MGATISLTILMSFFPSSPTLHIFHGQSRSCPWIYPQHPCLSLPLLCSFAKPHPPLSLRALPLHWCSWREQRSLASLTARIEIPLQNLKKAFNTIWQAYFISSTHDYCCPQMTFPPILLRKLKKLENFHWLHLLATVGTHVYAPSCLYWVAHAPFYFKILFSKNLCTSCGAKTHNSKITTHMLHGLSQPVTPSFSFLKPIPSTLCLCDFSLFLHN